MSDESLIPVRGKLQKTSSEPSQHRRRSTSIIGNKTNSIEANALPNYLRASIGSCHNFCKFGLKHDFKTIERTPMVKGFAAAPRKIPEPSKDDTLLEQKKSTFSNSRAPSISQSRISGRNKAMNPKPSDQELKQKTLRSKERRITTTGRLRQRDIEISTLKGASNSSHGQKSASFRNGKATRNSNTSKETYLLPTTTSLSRENGTVRVQKKVSHLKGNKNTTSPTPTRFQTRKTDAKAAPKKLSINLKSKDRLTKARMQQPNVEDVPEKIIYPIEMSTQNSKDVSSEEKEKQDPSSVLLPEIEVPTPQKIRTLSNNQKAREGKDHESQSPRKLKFRKGKVTEIQSENNGAGSRLKFRQAKQLANENQHKNAETMRKISSRKPDNRRDQSNETTNEVHEVVLRPPQHRQQKEHSQNLYNNVIRKTARKLVKTKKSKVKALVDAFETIISLQDDKPQGKVKT